MSGRPKSQMKDAAVFLRWYQDEVKSVRHLARAGRRENLSGMQHSGLEEGK